MKKIKITEQQAKMLKELNKRKVLKVTKEQYSKIVEFQNINETDSITKQFNNSLSREARKEFNNTKLPGIKEMYEEFINELYSVNEGCEKKYETLTKLMEMAGMVRNNKIVKEKFYNDKMVVEYAICEGLYEINNGGSPYRAMERIEEALSDEEIMQNIRKNINKIPVSSTNPTPPEKLEKELGFLRNRELNRREKESSDFKSLFDNIDEDAGDYPMGEATVAGASSQGGSSGPYVGNLGAEKKNELSNVSDELNDLITDEFEVNSNDDFILKKVIDQLSEIIKTPSVTPEIIEKESYK